MNVRAERINRGLTLPEFAKAVGVTYRVARQAEKGLPVREDSAKRLADYLGCKPMVFVEPTPPDLMAALEESLSAVPKRAA